MQGTAMRQIGEFIAVLACALFTGAAVYIRFVEHPARMQCGAVEGLVYPVLHSIPRPCRFVGALSEGVSTKQF
jgi:hypothetical protein